MVIDIINLNMIMGSFQSIGRNTRIFIGFQVEMDDPSPGQNVLLPKPTAYHRSRLS
jgi:hypothetical protein